MANFIIPQILTIALRHQKRPYADRIQSSRFAKSVRRKKIKKARKSGFYKYYFDIIGTARKKGKEVDSLPAYQVYDDRYNYQVRRHPERGDNITFISSIPEAFDKSAVSLPADGRFVVPNPFSLTLNTKGSFLFLKQLFKALDEDKFQTVILDFDDCEQIDIDALLCMDIMMDEFIDYYSKCARRKKNTGS